ncbi:MAG: phosphatidate cytidylyltransferase [Eubacterium sp.]|nr:phosphatidate cytidylyltransferase [Eubacterium sp.]
MATRIISAAIAIPVGILIIALNNEIIYYIAMAIFSIAAVYELLVATKYLKNHTISALSLIFTAITPFCFWLKELKQNIRMIYFVFLIALFVVMLFKHEKTRFEQVALTAAISIAIPLALSSIAFIRTVFPEHAIFLIVYTMISVWIGDAGAYFVGTLCGKHKMCPKISPKKTWEGFVGGLVTSAVFAVIMCFAYELIDSMINNGQHTFTVNWLYLTALAVGISVLGVVGDLTASLVKRECSVKDFGNFLPGHGGILDRFDSVLMAAPFAYLMYQLYFPITPIA